MKSSIYVFASDLHDEGYDRVLGNIRDRGGIQGACLASSYHHSRDLFPHNPAHKISYLEGFVFFQPEEKLYANTKMRPVVSPLVAEQDPLKTLTTEGERRGIIVRVWTNNMHNTNLGTQYPDCVQQNAFGDRLITNLCPSNPDVRAYVTAMSANLARYPIQGLLTETIIHMPFDHGYHHERTGLPLTGTHRYMMSLCFCPHCLAAGRKAGLDMERLRQFVVDEMIHLFNDEHTVLDDIPLDQGAIGALSGGLVGQYIQVRAQIITSLMTQIVEAVKRIRDIPVTFMDMSGGLRGAGSGMSVVGKTPTSPARAWQDGVDFAALAKVCDALSILGYTNDLKQLEADLTAYRQLLPEGYPISVAMRPMPPDSNSAQDVSNLIRVIARAKPEWVEFYHYALMRLSSLDWIKQGLKDNGIG